MISKIAQYLLGSILFAVTFFTNSHAQSGSGIARFQSLEKKRMAERSSPFKTAFRNIGPSVMSGRVTDVDVNPSDPTEFYVAYASGGLWYTRNNGLSFTPVFDSADVLTIGDIAVNWKSRTIWVGTGEVNSSRSSYAGIGVYKSNDRGLSWSYCGLPESHHIGKIQLHPSDTNTAFVAVLGHLYSPNRERGVYKTTDGGKSWKQTLFINDKTGVVDLDINPSNPKELYAAAWYRTRSAWNFEESGSTSGIYKSVDGGETWSLLDREGSGLPQGNEVGRIGIAIAPSRPSTIYAVIDNQRPRPDTAKKDSATYELDELKNLDLATFAKLNDRRLDTFLKRNRLTPRYSAAGIKELVAQNRIKPNSLYDYLYVNTGFERTPTGAEVYRSDNSGQTWQKTNKSEIPIFFTYGYYFAKIYVDPSNTEKVYTLGFSSQVSTDGGRNWRNMDKPNVHADHHALWINPSRPGHLINGNDGGVNITYDDGETWFKANTPAVGQYYAIAVDGAKPYNVYGGLQDNGVWYLPSTSGRNSFANSGLGLVDDNVKNLGGGDGMQVQVDPRNNATVYYGSQFGSYARTNRITREGGRSIRPRHEMGEKPARFNWQTPILLSPHNPEILYMGSHRLHRSFNGGDTMMVISGDLTRGGRTGDVPYGTITSISESPLRFGLLYTGSDDGSLHVSKDAGASWRDLNEMKTKNGLPKELWVSRILASRHAEGRVFLTLNGYRNDDFNAYVFVSEDYGNTWKAANGNLPMEPVNVIREDPKNPDILYAGTDGGLYVSVDRGKNYLPWTKGLPRAVPVHDIAIQERENEIVLGTHGRSIYIASLDELQKLR